MFLSGTKAFLVVDAYQLHPEYFPPPPKLAKKQSPLTVPSISVFPVNRTIFLACTECHTVTTKNFLVTTTVKLNFYIKMCSIQIMCRNKCRKQNDIRTRRWQRSALSDSQPFNVGILAKLEPRPTLREVKDTSRSTVYLDSFRVAMYYLFGFEFLKRLASWLALDYYYCIRCNRDSRLVI